LLSSHIKRTQDGALFSPTIRGREFYADLAFRTTVVGRVLAGPGADSGKVLREAEALDDAQMFCFLRHLDFDGDAQISARDVYSALTSPAAWPTHGYARRNSLPDCSTGMS